MSDNLDALRHIEGFPVGDDEDILALSDPPHYTAYPNPHIAEFIAQHGKPYNEATDDYHREPYAADVSEGKSDPLYRAITYHTKVPYKAIIPFIEHYTEPGDIVFDGFCGTGMTGVAAQMVRRRAILCDLSPAATFIAFNTNSHLDAGHLSQEAKLILEDVEQECGWMFQTRHKDGRLARVNYVVWSDIYVCPYCDQDIVFWDQTVDLSSNAVSDQFPCPRCGATLTNKVLGRLMERSYDTGLGSVVDHACQKPVLINYSVDGRRYERRPDGSDIELIRKISELTIPYWYPTLRMPNGDESRRNDPQGITHTHQFYSMRNLWILSAIRDRMMRHRDRNRLMILLISVLDRMSVRNRYMPQHRGNRSREVVGPLSGTLYVPIFSLEVNPIDYISSKAKSTGKALAKSGKGSFRITTQSTTQLPIDENAIDYIFTDPPFGNNLQYSELSFLWEAWMGILTNNGSEAVINNTQGKSLDTYRGLMTACFVQMYRVLKPGRWITVVFHNSKASVWNAIQEALVRAGFLVAQVTVMDKQKGTIKQLTGSGSVKNDLVINAYKPRRIFEHQFIASAGIGQERAFVLQHLEMLPVTLNIERTREMLYSKLLAYYVQRGYQIQYNADQFYRLLDREFVESDGYFFRDEAQRGEYETRKLKLKQKDLAQVPIFVLDERSALQWLWHFLSQPRSYSDIYTAYVKALQAREDEIPELRPLLEENFVFTGSAYRRPDVATKQELEQKRQARLLREFDDYLLQARAGRKLKDVRKEAVIAGFTQAYREQRFADILAVGRKLDKKLVEASTEIFDFMDIAEAKVER